MASETLPNTGPCRVCLAQIQNTHNELINEYTPLIYRPRTPRHSSCAVLLFGFLMLIFFFGCTIGFYLITVETRELQAQDVIMFSSRHNWKAAFTENLKDMVSPSRNIFLVYTNSSPCFDHHSCSNQMRLLQKDHIKRNYTDLLYNFVIAGDNRIYEGRGWRFIPDEAGLSDNATISVAFLGFPGTFIPTLEQIEQLKLLLAMSIANHRLIHCFSISSNPEDRIHFQDVYNELHSRFIKPKCI